MGKRYIAYVDTGTVGSRKGFIASAVLAVIDTRGMTAEALTYLQEYENGGGDEEAYLDDLRPYFYHIGIDFQGVEPVVFVEQEDPENEIWPVYAKNVYKTYTDAEQAFLRELGKDSIEKGIIEKLM